MDAMANKTTIRGKAIMILSDEEIINLWWETKDLTKFAREVERAVLARVSQQEPTHYARKDGGAVSAAILESGTEKQKELYCIPLYEHPAPPQAAAIPERFIEAIDHMIDLLEYVPDRAIIIPEPTDNTLLRTIKKIVIKLRDLSAAPKPEPKPMIDFDYMKNKDSKPEKINDGDLEFFVYPDLKPESKS